MSLEQNNQFLGKRIGLSVWIKNSKSAQNLKKYGNIHYVSRKQNYVCLYVDRSSCEQTIQKILALPFVSRAEFSHRHEVPFIYENAKLQRKREEENELIERKREEENELIERQKENQFNI